MNIFLTGANGFIGSHFLRNAYKENIKVVAITRDKQKVSPSLAEMAEWIETDLIDISQSHLTPCNTVVHLASCGVSPQNSTWEDLLTYNVLGTANLIHNAHSAGVRKFILAGSAHEYGRSALSHDSLQPCDSLLPITMYASSKAASFELAYGYASANNLQLYYGRIFQAYGEGQNPLNFWPALRTAAIGGCDFKMSAGTQILDFIPVEIVAKKLLNACFMDIEPGCPIIENIASGTPSTLLDFAKKEWERLGAKGRLLIGEVSTNPNSSLNYIAMT
jgi:UDP-glucose 4-epimerase